MPKIRRIRIANYQYNDGNVLIPDEIWDCGENSVSTLFNMENTAGKTTIVQAIMQPIIPRVKIAGRDIEGYFSRPSDHAYIVLEWNLDNSDMKLMTGISIASGNNVDADGDRTPHVRYYTFLSTYPADDNRVDTLCGLPLSYKDENGNFVPAAFEDIRNLSKKVGTLERYSSDDRVRWRERLAEFGISQDEFLVIAEINNTEGGIGKFFESKDVLKSSDSLVNKLFLPRIESKDRSNVDTTEDISLESMIQAYAVEDMSLEKQVNERQSLKGYSVELTSVLESTNVLWGKNEEFISRKAGLYGFLDALVAEKNRLLDEKAKLKEEIDHIKEEQRHIRHEKVSKEYYEADKHYREVSEQLAIADENAIKAEELLTAAKHNKDIIESAIAAKDMQRYDVRITALENAISELENNSDKAATLNSLKYSAKVAIEKELGETQPMLDTLNEKLALLEGSIGETEKAIKELDKRIQELNTLIIENEATRKTIAADNDSKVESLGMDIQRHLDLHYGEGDLSAWNNTIQEEHLNTVSKIGSLRDKQVNIDHQLDDIPQELRKAEDQEMRLKKEYDNISRQIDEYNSQESEVQYICNRRSIAFETRFTEGPKQYIDSLIAQTKAKLKGNEQKKSSVEHALMAIKQGTLHIPSAVIEFLDSNNITYVSVEHYLKEQIHMGILSAQQVVAFLNQYPYAAYGIKIENNAYELILKEAENQDWLPSVLPVFTADDIDDMLIGKPGTDMKLLSVFAQDYFHDMDSYTERLELKRDALEKKLKDLQNEEECLSEEATTLKFFAEKYDDTWIHKTEQLAVKTQSNIKEAAALIDQIKTKANNLKAERTAISSKIEELNDHKRDLEEKLKTYSALLNGLEKELQLESKISADKSTYSDLISDANKLKSKKDAFLTEKGNIADNVFNVKQLAQKLQSYLSEVKDASQTDMIEGTYEELIEKYKALSTSQTENIRNIRDQIDGLKQSRNDAQRRLGRIKGVEPDEYLNAACSDELLDKAIIEIQKAEANKAKTQEESSGLKVSYGRADSTLKIALSNLEPYGGKQLPIDQVGSDFERRIKETSNRISEHDVHISGLDEHLIVIIGVINNAEDFMDKYERPDKVTEVTLNSNIKEQYTGIRRDIETIQRDVEKGEADICDSLLKIVSRYKDALPASVIDSIKEMQKLLKDKSIKGDRYYTLSGRLSNDIELSQKRINQINTDLSNHDQMKDNLINQCVIQGSRLFNGLHYIASNTKVKVYGIRRQMIMFDIPKTVDETVAKATITTEIDDGIAELKRVIKEDPTNKYSIEKAAHKIVGNENIIRKYIGTEKILVKAFKVDKVQENSVYRTWESMNQNSGAQKTIIYFAIVLALMAYSRNSIGEINDKRGSVLPLDNPFGAMTSAHVVQTWFELANMYNVQLVCFSDIKTVDVIKLFDNVVRLKTVQRKASHKSIIVHDGGSSVEHIFYRAEQVKMF